MTTLIYGLDCGATNTKIVCRNGKTFTIVGQFPVKDLDFTGFVSKLHSFIPNRREVKAVCFANKGGLNYLPVDITAEMLGFEKDTKIALMHDASAVAAYAKVLYPNAKKIISVTTGTHLGAGIASDSNSIPIQYHIYNTLRSRGYGYLTDCTGEYLHKNYSIEEICGDNTKVKDFLRNAGQCFGKILAVLFKLENPDILYVSGGNLKHDAYLNGTLQSICQELNDSDLISRIVIAPKAEIEYLGAKGATHSIS